MHPVGFEPTTSKKESHYECGAIDHSAMDAFLKELIVVSIYNFFLVEVSTDYSM